MATVTSDNPIRADTHVMSNNNSEKNLIPDVAFTELFSRTRLTKVCLLSSILESEHISAKHIV